MSSIRLPSATALASFIPLPWLPDREDDNAGQDPENDDDDEKFRQRKAVVISADGPQALKHLNPPTSSVEMG